jgi:hypothetical protein
MCFPGPRDCTVLLGTGNWGALDSGLDSELGDGMRGESSEMMFKQGLGFRK